MQGARQQHHSRVSSTDTVSADNGFLSEENLETLQPSVLGLVLRHSIIIPSISQC